MAVTDKEVNVNQFRGPRLYLADPVVPVRGVRQTPEDRAAWAAASGRAGSTTSLSMNLTEER